MESTDQRSACIMHTVLFDLPNQMTTAEYSPKGSLNISLTEFAVDLMLNAYQLGACIILIFIQSATLSLEDGSQGSQLHGNQREPKIY